MIEEHVVGDEFGHRHDAPASDLFKPVAQLFHIGNAAVGQRKRFSHGEEFVTGAVLQRSNRATEQTVPPIMLDGRIGGPVLVDGEIRIATRISEPVLWSCAEAGPCRVSCLSPGLRRVSRQ